MSAQLFYMPFGTVYNSHGLPSGAATVSFYASGTTTFQPIYADAGLTQVLPNPITADALGGLPDIYMPSNLTYRVRILDIRGAQIGVDIDPYIPGAVILGTKGDPGGNVMAIGLFTSASGLNIPTGTDLVQTSGYSARGIGTARYIYDPAVDSTYVTAHPRTSFMSANARGFRLDFTQRIYLEMAGGANDGQSASPFTTYTGTDNLPSLNALIGAAPLSVIQSSTLPQITINMAAGGYYFSDVYETHAVIQFKGVGGEQDYAGFPIGTVWMYPREKGAVIVQSFNTSGRMGFGTTGLQGSRGASFSGITFLGLGATTVDPTTINAGAGAAVQFRTSATLINCRFFNVAGNGIHIVGYTDGSPGQPYGEVNEWSITGGGVHDCVGTGLYVQGSDVNAGRCVGFGTHSCGRTGVLNFSYFTNTYLLGDIAGYGNTGVFYNGGNFQYIGIAGTTTAPDVTQRPDLTGWQYLGSSGGASTRFPAWGGTGVTYYNQLPILDLGSGSAFEAPYVETGVVFSYILGPSVVLGGTAGVFGAHLGPILGDAAISANSGIGRYLSTPSGSPTATALGSAAKEYIGTGDGTRLFHFRERYCADGGSTTPWYEDYTAGNFVFSYSGGKTIEWFSSPLGLSTDPQAQFGRGVRIGNVRAFPNFAIGGGTYATEHRIWQYGALGAGPNAQGEVRLNYTPQQTSPIFLQACTAAGSPGTFQMVASATFKGATANRPASLGAAGAGVQYFDTTLAAGGKPIWWTGTAWVDATGATV